MLELLERHSRGIRQRALRLQREEARGQGGTAVRGVGNAIVTDPARSDSETAGMRGRRETVSVPILTPFRRVIPWLGRKGDRSLGRLSAWAIAARLEALGA